MATWNETLQQLVNEDYDSLLNIARGTLNDLMPTFKELDPDNEGAAVVFYTISSAVASDGKLTALERKFICDLLGVSSDSVSTMLNAHDAKMDELVDSMVDNFPQDESASLLLLVATVAACDETISREENAFLKRLLA